MKKIWVILILTLFGCDDRYIKQSITKADVTICWYSKEGTRDFVSFTGADKKETILFSTYDTRAITNIDMKSDSLIISGYDMDYLNMKKIPKTIDFYKVIVRKVSYGEWLNHYQPKQTVTPN